MKIKSVKLERDEYLSNNNILSAEIFSDRKVKEILWRGLETPGGLNIVSMDKENHFLVAILR